MAPWLVPEMSAWNRRALTIPPDSWRAWVRLALWEFWMGMLLCLALGLGVQQIAAAPGRVVTVYDFSNCYVAQVVLPCERIVYQTGGLNVAFGFMMGLVLLVIAAWLLWELWLAVKPRPIADEFLKLLHRSFGHDWRNPFTWPWARLTWAYGFTLLGAASMAVAGLVVWTLASSSGVAKAPAVHVGTSQSFRLDTRP